ncbi:hypothetical protein [Bordetella phage vB_BbrM_PHB04]|uniref:Uncharacterized protein n=1 Tax=Bordetella phage vB_BbrM_PHB04 TaxID=2029657 RepID=A0A291LAS1_9CAUD|nr:hypothetical protein HOS14_gp090 [Bordetella phage vB_BbrM_PHB04]ATI15708.1 hypothetical protein [Bordetella phage vB_BbrM_PHB04]
MQRDDWLDDKKDPQLECDEAMTPLEAACMTLCVLILVVGFGTLAYWNWFA